MDNDPVETLLSAHKALLDAIPACYQQIKSNPEFRCALEALFLLTYKQDFILNLGHHHTTNLIDL
jgi:hypothetical protein